MPDADFQKVFVIIAAYNEKSNLGKLLPALLKLPVPGLEVVVVDDNSPDGTPDFLRTYSGRDGRIHPLIRQGKLGYGSACIAGFRFALDMGADAVVSMDADLSHNPDAIPGMLATLKAADLVIGSRYTGGVRVLNWSISRLLLSLFANKYVNLIFRLGIKDYTSGFRAYRRKPLEHILANDVHSHGYCFLVEMVFRVARANGSIREFPIIYTERRAGKSKMSKAVIFESVFRPWIFLVQSWFRRRR